MNSINDGCATSGCHLQAVKYSFARLGCLNHRAQADDVQKVTLRCSISGNQATFCGRANHKRYFEAKTSSIFRLFTLKQAYGIIIGGRGP